MKMKGVREFEVVDAKDYLMYSFPLKMTRNSSLAGYLSVMNFYDLGGEYFNMRNSYFNDVSLDEVDRAAHELLDLNNLILVVVGPK